MLALPHEAAGYEDDNGEEDREEDHQANSIQRLPNRLYPRSIELVIGNSRRAFLNARSTLDARRLMTRVPLAERPTNLYSVTCLPSLYAERHSPGRRARDSAGARG